MKLCIQFRVRYRYLHEKMMFVEIKEISSELIWRSDDGWVLGVTSRLCWNVACIRFWQPCKYAYTHHHTRRWSTTLLRYLDWCFWKSSNWMSSVLWNKTSRWVCFGKFHGNVYSHFVSGSTATLWSWSTGCVRGDSWKNKQAIAVIGTPHVTEQTRSEICRILAWGLKQLEAGTYDMVNHSGRREHPGESSRWVWCRRQVYNVRFLFQLFVFLGMLQKQNCWYHKRTEKFQTLW